MRLIILGAPGAGKGTQAAKIVEKLNIIHISTGDIFRYNIKQGTELGKLAKAFIDKGMFVPDDVTVDIVGDRLKMDDCKTGFILDGFPRTLEQAEYLENFLISMNTGIDYVVNVEVPEAVIVKRISGRRVCANCGASYHIDNAPPKVENKCDTCSNTLIQREDDCEETVLMRLKVYHSQTEPLIEYYKEKGKLLTIVGKDGIDEITKEIFKALGVN